MKNFLAANVVKLIALAAIADLIAVLLREFGIEFFAQRVGTIAYAQKLAMLISVINALSVVLFWAAFAAVAVMVSSLYQRGPG